ncbi:MAG: VRR-NUC domain-containing protein, partial [Oceanospirillum sp.]|nr:VRR-NUC domain-containing protein [Oceanospirillum sp.]
MSQDVTNLSAPSPASLSDPFYYLLNARQVIDWCLRYHSDLLLDQERDLLNAFVQLPESAQGLLIRLIMRKGELFRTDSLDYAEIHAEIGDDLTQAMEPLAQIGLIDPVPVLSLPALTTLCR